jgi:type IV pilus assembly protein PilA
MRHKFLPVAAGIAALALVSCQKNQPPASTTSAKKSSAAPKPLTIEVVKENERSRNFAAVNKQLELGGTLYGYVDVEGDVLKLTSSLQAIVTEVAKTQPEAIPFAQQDYAALGALLGLTDIKALGVSSVPDGTGQFRNRMFLYTGGERHGLMAGLGGKPGPFKHLDLAPADATLFGETELDLGVVYRTIKDVVTKIAGEPAGSQFELGLKRTGEALALSLVDLIYGLKGRSAVVLRLDAEHTTRFPGRPPIVVPGVSLLVCIDGVAPIVEAALGRARGFRRSDTGTLHVYDSMQRLPIEGIQPVIVADGPTLYLATSLEFFDECRARKGGLAQSAEFQQALKHVGNEGNGLTYVSPKLFEQVRKFEQLNPNLPPQMKSMLAFTMARMPAPKQPMIAVRTNLDDGILIRSYLNRSMKQELAGVAVYFPVGLVAAMAIPAFQKVQTASQEKAVLNNLRMLAAAADQHYLETGTRSATYDQLVGPEHYVKAIQPVAGEDYRALRFVQGEPLRVRLPNGKLIEYKP